MINLSRHIEYQLLYHDTVVVPQLGTFKATYVPSKWVEEEEILLPPYRALTFTQEVDETDTRFVETISASYQISTEEAYIVTLEFTENIQQELAEYGSSELGSIGEFIKEEATNKIQFIPCQAGVASPSLYGLDAIHVCPSKEDVSPTPKQENKKMSVNADAKNITISINKRLLHYAAAVAASIVLFFAFSTPVSENILTKQQVTRSELFFPTNLIALPQAKSIQSDENNEATVSEKVIEEESNYETTAGNQLSEETNSKPKFSIILCCGITMQNAESYCQNLNERGIKAVVDNSGKFIRVLIPGYTSKEDALTEIRSLRSKSREFSKAWIMENK
ncbi:MAG: SPOR domain-containing protein [Bacteroidaceae bacterium]|nr:SPOR domain-containing protein [Bacteroidaceae bacterium]